MRNVASIYVQTEKVWIGSQYRLDRRGKGIKKNRDDAAKRLIVFAFASLIKQKTIRIQQMNSRSSNSGFTDAKCPRDSVVEHDNKAMHATKREINAIENGG